MHQCCCYSPTHPNYLSTSRPKMDSEPCNEQYAHTDAWHAHCNNPQGYTAMATHNACLEQSESLRADRRAESCTEVGDCSRCLSRVTTSVNVTDKYD